MPVLRRGITGFDVDRKVDFAAFKEAVHAAARSAGASLIRTVPGDGVTPNFHQADVQLGGRELSILCNRAFPIVAVVECPIVNGEMQPVDLPNLTDPMAENGYEVVFAAELARAIAPDDLQALSDSERDQAKYWKPKCIGQVVFNWWD